MNIFTHRFSLLFLLLLAFLLFQTTSCKVKSAKEKHAHKTTSDIEEIEESNLVFDNNLQRVFAKQLNFEWLSLRCKTSYSDNVNSQQFSSNIRIKKDSIIWLSLTGPLGIEGARLVITQDSFFLINRLNREYTARPISYLNEIVPMNTNLQMLQNLLTALPIAMQASSKRFFQSDSFDVFQLQNKALRQIITVHQQNYTIKEIMLADQVQKQDLRIIFGNYRNLSSQLFPFDRTIKVNRGNQKMDIELDVQRYSINEPLKFPFEVNENYKKN